MGKSGGLRVHVLDEDAIVVDTLQQVLDRLGHAAVPVRSTEELLEELEGSLDKMDMVLADMATLGRDGTALMAQLHERYPHLHFVLMTQRGDSIPPEQALACGVQGYIRKPVQFSELELVITRLSEHLDRAGDDTWTI